MSSPTRWRDRVEDLAEELLSSRHGTWSVPTVNQVARARADAMRVLSPTPTVVASAGNIPDTVLCRLGVAAGARSRIADFLRRGEGVRLLDGAVITPTSGGGVLVARVPGRGAWRTSESRGGRGSWQSRASSGDGDGDGQTLEGYAAVFNQWTDISDHVGVYREQIAPGAFKRSIGVRTAVLQFDHGNHPTIGSMPLGSISTAREDRNGLFVRARLSDNWLIRPVRDAIRDRAITGMSIRFRVVTDEWGNGGEHRTIRDVDLFELGPVVFPAYQQTSVGVRAA